MQLSKIKIFFLSFLLIGFIACEDSAEIADKANKDILNDKEALSSDLVNNPSSNNASSDDLLQAGKLSFKDTIHDFGDLKEGEIIEYEFEYENVGKKEILITNAKGSCGCTVPEYDSKPIAPGAKGIMKVTFNSKGKLGYNEKNVQISTNGFPSKYKLTIMAKVD